MFSIKVDQYYITTKPILYNGILFTILENTHQTIKAMRDPRASITTQSSVYPKQLTMNTMCRCWMLLSCICRCSCLGGKFFLASAEQLKLYYEFDIDINNLLYKWKGKQVSMSLCDRLHRAHVYINMYVYQRLRPSPQTHLHCWITTYWYLVRCLHFVELWLFLIKEL